MKKIISAIKGIALKCSLLWLLPVSVFAQNNPISLGQFQTQVIPLQKFYNLLNDLAKLLSGPWALFIVIAAMVLAVGTWIWSPDNKQIAWLLRAVAGGILLLTMGAWLTQLGGAL